MAKKKGKGRGWHGDSAGHARAAKKSGGKTYTKSFGRAGTRTGGTSAGGAAVIKPTVVRGKTYTKSFGRAGFRSGG